MGNYFQKDLECMPREQIKALQGERLVKTVKHVWDNVPYYRAKMEAAGVTPDDIKGLTICVMENEAYITFFSTLGANPVPMAYSEVFTGIQNGTVDGTVIPIAAIYMTKMYTVAPYITRSQDWYCPVTVLMSMDAWNSMTPEQQEIFQQCFNEGRDYMRQQLTDNEEAQVQAMIDEGCTVTAVDKAEWLEQCSAAVEAVKKAFVGKYVSQETLDYIAKIGENYK